MGIEALYQITQAECETELDSIKIKHETPVFTEHYLPKLNTHYNRENIVLAKQTENKTPEELWRQLIRIEKEYNFNTISAEELLI